MCGQGPCKGALLIAGFFDGVARAFRLLSAHCKDSARDSTSCGNHAFAVPDNTHFLHAATFVNPSVQEGLAFIGAHPTTDGSAAVLLLGNMGGRSLFSTSAPLNDLQPWHYRQQNQDYYYLSAMLWPRANKTMIVSDCSSCSVDEIHVLAGEGAAQQRTILSRLHSHSAQVIPEQAS
jgi:hypothetical protein